MAVGAWPPSRQKSRAQNIENQIAFFFIYNSTKLVFEIISVVRLLWGADVMVNLAGFYVAAELCVCVFFNCDLDLE